MEKNEDYKIVDGVLYPDKDFMKDTESKEMDWDNCEYRIRKLTSRECYRLMGVAEEDIDKMQSVNSSTQCYKQAGNSIVISVLCAIFSQLNIKGVTPWNELSVNERYAIIDKGCFTETS